MLIKKRIATALLALLALFVVTPAISACETSQPGQSTNAPDNQGGEDDDEGEDD